MTENKYFRFYVSRDQELLDLPAENAGTLYVGNIINEDVYWFDNDNSEWYRSLYPHSKISKDPEFTPVTRFDNGYVTSDDAIYYLTSSKKVIIPNPYTEEITM